MTLHESRCPLTGLETEHSDAAKRLSDTYRLHRLADPIGNTGRWFACALADGSSDHVLYDTRRDAVTHQRHNETYYCFVQIVPHDMNHCQAESFLGTHRKMYDAGIKLTDRDHRAGGRVLIPRVAAEDQQAQMRSLLSGGKFPQTNIRLPRR
jgi:hypothetical protein